MDSAFVKEAVGGVLADALAEAALQRPEDPVEFIAQFLLKHVENTERRAKEPARLRQLAERDGAVERDSEVAAEAARSAELSLQREREAVEAFVREIDGVAAATDADAPATGAAQTLQAFLPRVVQWLCDAAGASGAYLGQLEGAVPDEGEEPAEDAPGAVLRYVAASRDQEFLLQQQLDQQKHRGVTFAVFARDEAERRAEEGADEEPEPEEEEIDEADEAAVAQRQQLREQRARAKEERRMAILNRPRFVYVPNVVVGKAAQSLHFFRLPRLGAYFAARLKLRVTMDASVLRAAVERKLTPAAEEPAAEAEPAEDDEDGEKKAAPKAAPAAERPIDPRADAEACLKDAVLPVRQYALCLDTLGQERPLTDQQMDLARRIAGAVQRALERVDRRAFVGEFQRWVALRSLEDAARRAAQSADEAAEKAAAKSSLKLAEDVREEIVEFYMRRHRLVGNAQWLAGLRECEVFDGSLPLLRALLVALGAGEATLWPQLRLDLSDDMIERLTVFDVTPEGSMSDALAARIQQLLTSAAEDERVQDHPLYSSIEKLLSAALAARTAAADDRAARAAAAAEAEAARVAAEAEAAAAAAPEADAEAEEAAEDE